jgi:hypothetical protein
MKNIHTLFIAAFLGTGALAQCTTVVTGSTNVSCFGGCNGSASVTTVGTSPFTYSWAPGGQNIQNPNTLCAGTHTVVVMDANSCLSTATVTITQPALLQDSMAQVNIASCDSCNGTATAYPYGGTAPYTHKWSTTPAQTNATATNLCPGTYHDTIKDLNGCLQILTVTITQAFPLSVSGTITNVSTNTSCDGGVSASPTGGTSPYTYTWMPGGQTTSAIIGQCPGTYTLCVSDANGCSVCDTTVTIGVTGIREEHLSNGIHISPNPGSGKFQIEVDDVKMKGAAITIYNAVGEKRMQLKLENGMRTVDLSSEPDGIYFITIGTNGAAGTKRLIIQH